MAVDNKRLGVIGGMGPKATSVFMDQVIEHTVADRDQDHIDMVVLNHATLPDRTTVILENAGERFLRAVERDLRLLEQAGADHIAIPCNTSHYFYDEMQAMTSIPIIHMVEETIKEIGRRFGSVRKVGVLATNGTLRSGVYRKVCDKYGLELQEPEESVQREIMNIIYNDIKRGRMVSSEGLERIILDLVEQDGCDCVIIACTELSCIRLGEQAAGFSVDAMDVLVRKSIELSGKHYG